MSGLGQVSVHCEIPPRRSFRQSLGVAYISVLNDAVLKPARFEKVGIGIGRRELVRFGHGDIGRGGWMVERGEAHRDDDIRHLLSLARRMWGK